MYFAGTYLRSIILSLVATGLIVPAWATQPCQCGKEGHCDQASSCCRDEAKSHTCCHSDNCCAADEPAAAIPASNELCNVGCPCCTEAPVPSAPTPQSTEVTSQAQQSLAVVADVPSIIPPVVSTEYLARELGSPPGHHGLRLHALYRVWLN